MKVSNVIKRFANGNTSGASVPALNVLVCPAAEGGFVAQGIEIDYVATGSTEEQARLHFAYGFTKTIAAYLERGRPFDGLFKSRTPQRYIQQYFSLDEQQPIFQCLVEVERLNVQPGIPRMLAFRHDERNTYQGELLHA